MELPDWSCWLNAERWWSNIGSDGQTRKFGNQMKREGGCWRWVCSCAGPSIEVKRWGMEPNLPKRRNLLRLLQKLKTRDSKVPA